VIKLLFGNYGHHWQLMAIIGRRYETGNMPSTIRTFVAADLPDQVGGAIARLANRMGPAFSAYRMVPRSILHLTLNFLGDVPDRQAGMACEAVARVARGFEPFECSLGSLGAFPKPVRPRILWIGIGDRADLFTRMHYAIQEVLEPLEIEHDRMRFFPHITIGRLRDGMRWPEAAVEMLASSGSGGLADSCRGIRFPVDSVTVYSSYLERDGAVHTPMSHVMLGGIEGKFEAEDGKAQEL
jgi:RNA 2',3'-cyclic 3'-phosphodiesterase